MAGVEEMVRNKQVVLKHFVVGEPKETDMEFRVGKASLRIPEGVEGAILVKNLYLSCDPYMRGRMREYYESYIPPFQPGSVIEGFGVAKVVDTTSPKFSVGDYIVGLTGWEEYSVIIRTEQLRKIETHDVPLSYHVGLLGMPGFTAYVGFYEICSPKKGDYFFVSAASGAVGQLVALMNMRVHGRVAICGMVSQHSISDPKGISNLYTLVMKRVRMQGFIQSDYLHLHPEFLKTIVSFYKQGKIVYIEDMNEGLENGPAAFVGLFSGKNVGKQIVCVTRE
ncbi:hypothetical protein BHE74_00049293 [Ensete ventricosum]|nr:hypothetical protein BHE74_00049293 [Ensete ventricosum]